jgi:hypothetical protein
MYVHGIVTNGVRGVHLDNDAQLADENREEYGIDWEEMDRPAIRNHFNTFNLPAENDVNSNNENPFIVNHPDRLSHIEVPDARCPFDAHKFRRFNTQLANLPTVLSLATDMHSHRLTWINALALATAIAQD